jgi:hypothetical protein
VRIGNAQNHVGVVCLTQREDVGKLAMDRGLVRDGSGS